MKRSAILILATFILSMMLMSSAQAEVVHTVDFWFALASDPTGTPITVINVEKNATFDLAVWYQTSNSFAASSMELFIGWDKTTKKGTLAVEGMEKKITNNLGNVGFIVDADSPFPTIMDNNIGGANGIESTERYFGSHLSMINYIEETLPSPLIINTTPTKIGILSLKNTAIPMGQSYIMAIITNPLPSLGWSSDLGVAGIQNNELENTTLKVNSVPEPATLAGLLAFAPALIGAARRKR